MTAGTLRFDRIPPLADGWDPDTYYLWGANEGNMFTEPGSSLAGLGMAGPGGPTGGLAHPQYIGVNTMSISGANDAQFEQLATWIDGGHDVVVPTFEGKYSLGTGIGASMDSDVWRRIQHSIIEALAGLADRASAVVVPAGTYWPDCRRQVEVAGRQVSICDPAFPLDEHCDGAHPIVDARSLQHILQVLER